jgi:hypothetical protein
MRSLKIVAPLLVIMLWPTANTCRSEVNIGLSLGEDGIKGFYLAIGDHYQVEEKVIVTARKKNLPDEEMPVVFFLARNAAVSPEVIVKLRLGGKSWMEITHHFNLTAELYYVPVERKPGPPYGKAYGHFKNKKKTDWKSIQLSDPDIVNFVNLKFISAHYGYSPDEVITMREKGNSFVDINTAVKKNKGKSKKQTTQIAASEKQVKKDKGKGKGRKKK